MAYQKGKELTSGDVRRSKTSLLKLSIRADFRMTLKNGFGKCSLLVLSANGWKDQNMASSFSRQRQP